MDLKLPKLGEGSDSGVVVSIFVNEGDTIAKDQTIIELENEKAVAAVPATAGGVVAKIHIKAGDKISVGQRILTLSGASGAPVPAAAPTAAKPAKAAAPKRSEPEPEAEEEVVEVAEEESSTDVVAAPVASPSLRRWARELGINLGKIRGSGPGGRIETSDVKNYIGRLQASAAKARRRTD
jgi:pyruvate dehydrogenase E2 component (dihydrolipoamide acetyltransferase)